MAPEKLLRLECNFASDVWSFGLIAFELATNRFPYDVTDCKTELEIKTMIVSSPAPLIFQKKTVAASSERCHPELWHHFADFLARSLFKSPLLRLSADELCNHAYVATRKANLLPDVNTLKLWTHDFAAAISAQEAAEVDPTPKPRYMMCN
jgi:serine/threonine protein kinase